MQTIRTGTGLYFVNAANGAPAPLPGTTFDQIPGTVNAFGVSADGSALAVATPTVATVATAAGAAAGAPAAAATGNTISFWDPRTGTVKRTVTVPGTPKKAVTTSLALNDDGSMVAAGDWDGHVHLWSTATGSLTATLDTRSGWTIGGAAGGRG